MVELCEHRALLAEIDNFALKINSLHISAAKVSRKGILILEKKNVNPYNALRFLYIYDSITLC